MATLHLHIRGLRTTNILQRLVNDGFQTGCGPNSLSSLSEDANLPYLSAVDKALVAVFRRLEGSGFQGARRSDSSSSAVKSTNEVSVTAESAKRSRRCFDFQPTDGLTLLLDLMPITSSNGSFGHRTADSVSSEGRRTRESRNAGYLGTDNNVQTGARVGGAVEAEIAEQERGIGIYTNSDDFSTKVAKRFVQLGGLHIVISLLLLGTNHRPRFKEVKVSSPLELIVKDAPTKRLCLEVLARLCCLQEETADALNKYEEVSAFCFHCLACAALRDSAGKLIEPLLMARSEMLNLCSIPRLREVLSVLDGKKMASLCRILAITVSDLDIYENKQSLLAQNQQKRSNEFVPIRDINQELIMSVPGLLNKMVNMAVSDRYLPRYPNAPTEIDHWMRFIDDNISNEIANDVDGVRPNSSFATAVLSNFENSSLEGLARFPSGLEEQELPLSALEANLELSDETGGFDDTIHGFADLASITIGEHLLTRVEALYVLSLLLVGKHRKRMQKELAQLELIPKLSNLMDNFVWRHNSGRARTAWNLPGHSFGGCECSPEVAVKIQFLRLLHSFCDQSEYKHLLLTPCEFDELRRIQVPNITRNTFNDNPEMVAPNQQVTQLANDQNMSNASSSSSESLLSSLTCQAKTTTSIGGQQQNSASGSRKRRMSYTSSTPVRPANYLARPVYVNLMCRGTQGLLTKIVEVLKKEQTQSTFRFWLCRAVESFLRGRTSYADQIFLLRRGLLQHITASVINTESRHKEIIQSSFDLLGEMVKFNIDACKQLDAILNTEAKLKKTMILINDNLIDSNMFIRAMVLAADHFIYDYPSDSEAASFTFNSRLLAFFRDFDKHIGYVISLTRLVNVNLLTQENVSCLNTSLVILMLNRKRGKLKELLTKISQRKEPYEMSVRGDDSGQGMLENLRKLLRFWQEHYLHKDKDCTQLEKSSRIPFGYWKSTVELLTDESMLNASSLLYYTNTPSICLPSST